MKIQIKLISCLIFFLIFIYITLPPLAPNFFIENKLSNIEIVHVSTQNGLIDVELEEYLVGVIASEMPAIFELEALKAQAVASRTYVTSRGFNVDDSTNSQVYQTDEILRNKWKDNYQEYINKIQKAIDETRGQVMMYDHEIIHAFFFSSSNGKTNNSEDYWTTPYPYLKSVDSHFDEIKVDNERIKEIRYDELNRIFNEKVRYIEIIEKYENDYVKKVKVNNTEYSGREIREKCELSSSSFNVESIENGIRFITLGSGHGVGMSQYGAQGMALEGYNYIDILKHYYSGIEIMNK